MNFARTQLLWGLLLCLPLQIFGQKSTLSNFALANTFSHYKNENPSLNHQHYFEEMAPKMAISASSKMVLTQETSDPSGQKHYKFQQFHADLPIFGNHYILHEKDGVVRSANGRYSPNVSVVTKPNLDARAALAFAQDDMKANTYAPLASEPVLCLIDPAFPQVSETLRLVYQLELSSTDPVDKRRYFVDALTGQIIKNFPLLLKEGVPSTAKTRYYGVQNIITDSIAPSKFVLRDPTRGQGIFVLNDIGPAFTSTTSNWDLANGYGDEIALDAHYCTQEYYDMMLADYDWQGLDGQGKALKAKIHAGSFANAYWNGESTNYGDGDCNYGPLTTLEIVGHEFTHGMIDYTSRLIYDQESGAINESLADMFGKILERKTDPANFSWDLGHSFLLGADVKPFRYMDNPNALKMPALYKGLYWGDYNDVHTNSSIGNLWFSMVVDGKQGVNEVGTAFNVPALGMDKAGQIVFQVNKNYFTESSNYNNFYDHSVEVAESLFGAGSTEVLAVKEAWKAVGLPVSVPAFFDLSVASEVFSNESHCGIGTYIPVKFKVYNKGSIPYTPSSGGSVTLSSSTIFLTHTVQLTSPIPAGESLEILVDNWIKATNIGYIDVSVDLTLNDQESNNNSGIIIYEILASESDDLKIYTQIKKPKCFDDSLNIVMNLTNGSCETLLAGTEISFRALNINGSEFWNSGAIQLPYDLIAKARTLIPLRIPLLTTPITIELLYPNDPNLIDNTSTFTPAETPPHIAGDYLNTFDINSGIDDYLSITTLSQSNTLQYQSSRFFASTGAYQDSAYIQHCADQLLVFNGGFLQGANATLRSCLDFSSAATPVLEFDLAQFRSDVSNNEYSSVFSAKWIGAESGSQAFWGQPEGAVQHHSIQLPAYFKGSIELKLYTEAGDKNVNVNKLSTDDFVLLDNLRFRTTTTSTSTPSLEELIRLSPNPAQEITTIQSSESIRNILVQYANGQTLQNLQVNQSTYDLDLKGLKAGFYFLNIQLNSGSWVVKKLVKMD